MIHIFVNALAASAGGGLTYVRNVVPQLAERDDVQATILIPPALRREMPAAPNLAFADLPPSRGVLRRGWFEQRAIRALIRKSGADVLLSTGNFSSWRPGVPQILLSRNALYTSRDFREDLRRRGEHRLLLETRVKAAAARWSIRIADRAVAPSEAFAQELRQWTGKPVACIHHGFDAEAFTRDPSPLPDPVQQKLAQAADALKLLFVSHYNYYRNFESLLRALPLLKQQLAPRPVKLFLTCRLAPGANPGAYDACSAAKLIKELNLSDNVIELDTVPYPLLHKLYQAADIYVTPAYCESFAHPLVEAMSSGVPVVASDLAVHQEICGDAARYFARFSPEHLATCVTEVASAAQTAAAMSRQGLARAAEFSWRAHVESLVYMASELES